MGSAVSKSSAFKVTDGMDTFKVWNGKQNGSDVVKRKFRGTDSGYDASTLLGRPGYVSSETEFITETNEHNPHLSYAGYQSNVNFHRSRGSSDLNDSTSLTLVQAFDVECCSDDNCTDDGFTNDEEKNDGVAQTTVRNPSIPCEVDELDFPDSNRRPNNRRLLRRANFEEMRHTSCTTDPGHRPRTAKGQRRKTIGSDLTGGDRSAVTKAISSFQNGADGSDNYSSMQGMMVYPLGDSLPWA